MAATAIHRLTLDHMGKCSNAFFSETTNIIKAKLGSMLIYALRWRPSWISDRHIKHKFVEDLPMIIPGQFGFNCPSGWMFIVWSSTKFTFFVPIWNSKWRLRQDLV
jgi:hypothetical protein